MHVYTVWICTVHMYVHVHSTHVVGAYVLNVHCVDVNLLHTLYMYVRLVYWQRIVADK